MKKLNSQRVAYKLSDLELTDAVCAYIEHKKNEHVSKEHVVFFTYDTGNGAELSLSFPDSAPKWDTHKDVLAKV